MNGAGGNDGSGDAPGLAFLAVLIEDIGQLFGVEPVNDFGGIFTLREVEPHVQWSFILETEALGGIIELVGGEAEIEEDSIHLGEAVPGSNFFKIAKVAVNQGDALSELRQAFICAGESVGAGI